MGRMVVIVAGLALLAMAPFAGAAPRIERESLKGLRGIYVSVGVQDPHGGFRQYVDSASVRTRIELKLRQSGVRVMEMEDMLQDPRQPTLVVTAFGVPEGEGGVQFAVLVSLVVSQLMQRQSTQGRPIAMWGDTWRSVRLGLNGPAMLGDGVVDRAIDEECNELLNDWLATHGK